MGQEGGGWGDGGQSTHLYAHLQEALRKGPDVHLDAAQARVEEVAHHAHYVARRRRAGRRARPGSDWRRGLHGARRAKNRL
jgi:hypothetical protein